MASDSEELNPFDSDEEVFVSLEDELFATIEVLCSLKSSLKTTLTNSHHLFAYENG